MRQDEVVFSYTQWKYIFGQIGTMEDTALFQQFCQATKRKQRVAMQNLQHLDAQFIRLRGHLMKQSRELFKIATANERKQAGSKCTLFLEDVSFAKETFAQVSKLTQQWLDLATSITQSFENAIERLDKTINMYYLNGNIGFEK